MHEKKTYEQLENEYKELQFRVTRFSAVEQELINVRDQLDHELELYKRMHNYNGQALLAENEDDFYKSITDALVDVFELECGLVMIHDDHDQQLTKVVTEGIVISGLEEKFILETIALSSKFKTGKSVIVSQNHLDDFSAYKHLHTGLFSSVHEIKLGYSLFFGGFITNVNKDIYNPISERRLAMFAVFVQQMQAIFANRRRNDQLESQLKRIEKSERELKTLSLIATKSKNGVIITNTFGEIEWVNEAFSKISGYDLEEVKGRKPKDFLQKPDGVDLDAREKMSLALAKKENVEVSLVNYSKDGKPYYAELEIISVFNGPEEHINFIALQRDITEEINFKREIIRMNSRFELIAKQSNIGIWEFDANSGNSIWNDEMFKIYGAQKGLESHVIKNYWAECIHPDDSTRILLGVTKIMSGEIESVQEEYKIIRKNDSQTRYLQTVTIAERDDQGVLIRLVGSAIDYTETREANFKIKANEEKYRRIIEHMSLGLVEMDKEGEVVFVNPKFKELTLLEDASALIIPYQNPTALRNKVKNGDIVSFANVEEDVVEVDFIREDDKKMTLLVSTAQVKNQEGNTTGFISIYLDITTVKQLQKNLENALSERNQSIMQVNTMKGFYESILDHSPSEITVFDRNLNVTFSNGKNLKSSNLWNDSLRLILDPHLEGALPAHLEKIRAAITDKKLVQLEDKVKIEENEDLYTLRVVLPYYNDFGEFDNLIVTGVDITELKKIQIDIQDKNEELKKINLELDNFVYSISHDLRSPLLSIRGIISLILHDSKLDESIVSFLNLADNSITRLDNTIQEILDYSRNSRLEVAPALVDVSELVSTVFDDLRYSSDDGLKTDINIVGSPLIYSDKSRLGVLLKNIIGNSIKYRKPGVDTHIRFEMQKENDDIVIQISDNGEGIAPQNVDKVFNMFFRGTTNSVGTGLGLYICKEIVNKLGGSIRVESQLGIGTTMTVKLNQNNTTR